jgi:hypothetical protein
MLILYGDQGQGKSTFFRYLCGKDEYYQDNLDKFEGEKAFEKTENKWIVEAAELTFMSKSTTEQVKSFITARKDTIRFKYKKYSNDIYRQFVMLGTTNNVEFLTDKTGNRRFLIVNVKKQNEVVKNLFGDLKEVQADMEQIMAEAYHDYKEGMDFLVMPERFNKEILRMQGNHIIDDGKAGKIEQYLENIIEEKRKTDDKFGLRNYYCCVGQILVEALKYRENDKIPRAERNDIALIMSENKKWIKCDNPQRINTAYSNEYGNQRAYMYNYEADEKIQAVEERYQEKIEKEKEHITNNINNITNQQLDYDDYFMNL